MKTERFEMRVEPSFLLFVDAWRGAQVPIPSRAAAIQQLTMKGMEAVESVYADESRPKYEWTGTPTHIPPGLSSMDTQKTDIIDSIAAAFRERFKL